MNPNVFSAETSARRRPWLLYGPPEDGEYLIFAFPYTGTGASCYRDWPRRIGTGRLCPLQPPGRENRIREQSPRTHREFADSLADDLAGYLDRPYGLIGHCGSVPYLLEACQVLRARGLPLPRRLFASGWGSPQRGLYGRLNFIPLDTADMLAEIADVCARLGRPLLPELAEMAAEALLSDLQVQRGYRYDAVPAVPVPVSVIGWSADDVVAPDQVWPGWQDISEASYDILDGDHGQFLRGHPALFALIERDMALPGPEVLR